MGSLCTLTSFHQLIIFCASLGQLIAWPHHLVLCTVSLFNLLLPLDWVVEESVVASVEEGGSCDALDWLLSSLLSSILDRRGAAATAGAVELGATGAAEVSLEEGSPLIPDIHRTQSVT